MRGTGGLEKSEMRTCACTATFVACCGLKPRAPQRYGRDAPTGLLPGPFSLLKQAGSEIITLYDRNPTGPEPNRKEPGLKPASSQESQHIALPPIVGCGSVYGVRRADR